MQPGGCLWEEYVELGVEASTLAEQLWEAMRQSHSVHGVAFTGLYRRPSNKLKARGICTIDDTAGPVSTNIEMSQSQIVLPASRIGN